MSSAAASPGFFERTGEFVIAAAREAVFVVRFAYAALAAALTPSIYLVATREVTMRQIYFTAWKVLPWFVLFTGLFSFVIMQIVILVAREQGLSQFALELILRVLPLEAIPFLTALYVALRSGSAINTEVVLMHIRGDLEALERAGGNAMRDEFIPRIVGCAFSVVALTVVSSAVAFALAYVLLYGFGTAGVQEYTNVVARVFSLPVLAGLVAKGALFGIVVAVIPIASGLAVARESRQAPIAVLKGMVRLFFTLALVEIASLAVKYV
ncbi:MAG: MlaE family ABC transporter permease [Burkholderiales bacterium]